MHELDRIISPHSQHETDVIDRAIRPKQLQDYKSQCGKHGCTQTC